MSFEIFLVCAPGLEPVLADECRSVGFAKLRVLPGGVAFDGEWLDVWRANLELRGATRVLARIGSFRAFHLAQLDKRARKFDWGTVLRPDVPVRVEASSKRSKIYHAGAAAQRVERAISEELGAPIAKDAPVQVKVRIDDNLVTLSVDTSGESLHKRGHKRFTGKAPMRETMASLILRACGHDGTEPVLDPMCGSGTFVIEAAEMALGMQSGRERMFSFERFSNFNTEAYEGLKREAPGETELRFFGSDRDDGAIRGASENAKRAGVDGCVLFSRNAVSDVQRPDGPPGLVIVNPPYGGRIGDRKLLFSLHGAFGEVMRSRFRGWRVGMVTNDGGLAKATKLPFKPASAPIAHGGLKVRLFQTDPL